MVRYRNIRAVIVAVSLFHTTESFLVPRTSPVPSSSLMTPNFFAFPVPLSMTTLTTTRATTFLAAAALSNQKLSKLPKGISPFEKSISRSLDIQAEFRSLAKEAVDVAISSNLTLLEVEFPPLLGGDMSKSQFDDFDNIQELDKNKDWAMNFAPLFAGDAEFKNGMTWLVFPDLKECEIAKKEWKGQRYREATFTTIEAATEFFQGEGGYDAPWGASLVSGISKFMGGSGDDQEDGEGDAGLLGDRSSLDQLVRGDNAPASLVLVIQPGNGGPVEDWVNCEKIYEGSPETVMVVINGALDKVRGGYYPGVFFPKLAATVDRFFNKFESVFYLKPISDKGVYGWLYRVYPEPWQIVLQTLETDPKKKNGEKYVQDTTVYFSDKRPTYNDAVAKLVEASTQRFQQQ